MISRPLCVGLALAALLGTLRSSLSRAEDNEAGAATFARRLMSPNGEERARAFAELMKAREKSADSLLIVAHSTGDEPHQVYARQQAIVAIGELRAVEGIAFLARHLTCSFGTASWHAHPLDRYPAARSLWKIGSPAVPAVLGRLNVDISQEEINVIAWWVYSLDGKELGLARLKLELETGKKVPDKRRANLMRLIEVYQSIDSADMRQWPRP